MSILEESKDYLCNSYYGYQGGNNWSPSDSFISFFKDVVKLDIDFSKYEPWEKLSKHSSVRYVHEKFCIISDRPEILKQDEQNRPHCEDGAFCKWRDGMSLYAWHGVYVPEKWIMDKENLTSSEVLAESNAEIRRAGCEILGWDKVLEDPSLNPRIIDEDLPHIGTLIEIDLPEAPRQRFIKFQCGTGRYFAEPVNDNQYDTALKANAAGNGWRGIGDPRNYIPFIRT